MNKPIHIPKRGPLVGEQIVNIMDDKINNKIIEVKFRLGDVIQFYSVKNDLNNLVFKGDYKICGVKFYKFDLSSINIGVTGGTYIVSELNLSDARKTFQKNEYPLQYKDKIKKCYNKTNWSQPKWGINYYKYSGITFPGETYQNIGEPIASFHSSKGHGYHYKINREEGPQTIFTLKSIINNKIITLFDIQLYYYYKNHIYNDE